MIIIQKLNKKEQAQKRLEVIRRALRAGNISYGELYELQGLAKYIEPSDVELLEPAGVCESCRKQNCNCDK